jgi:hypothetical protein
MLCGEFLEVALISSTAQSLQYIQNPSLYPNGLESSFNVPDILNNIYMPLIEAVYKQPIIFIIPGIVFTLSKPFKQ